MSNKKKFYLGVDDGYAETKIVTENGTVIRIPSRARAGQNTMIEISKGGEKSIFEYKVDNNQVYSVGNVNDPDPISHDDYPTSDLNRVIVMHAIRKALELENADLSNVEIVLCTGLPLKRYYRAGQLNTALINEKRDSLLKNNITSADSDTQLPVIIRHAVLAEAIAAWMNIVIKRDKKTQKLVRDDAATREKMAIIDIGGRTTDIAVMENGSLNFSASSTIEVGMLSIHQLVEDEISVNLTPAQVDNAVMTGKIRMYGKDQDVSHIVRDAEATVVHNIRSEVFRRIGDARDFDRVVFVGGTSAHLKKLLSDWYPHQVFDKTPAFSNASGMQKYAELVMSLADQVED